MTEQSEEVIQMIALLPGFQPIAAIITAIAA